MDAASFARYGRLELKTELARVHDIARINFALNFLKLLGVGARPAVHHVSPCAIGPVEKGAFVDHALAQLAPQRFHPLGFTAVPGIAVKISLAVIGPAALKGQYVDAHILKRIIIGIDKFHNRFLKIREAAQGCFK